MCVLVIAILTSLRLHSLSIPQYLIADLLNYALVSNDALYTRYEGEADGCVWQLTIGTYHYYEGHGTFSKLVYTMVLLRDLGARVGHAAVAPCRKEYLARSSRHRLSHAFPPLSPLCSNATTTLCCLRSFFSVDLAFTRDSVLTKALTTNCVFVTQLRHSLLQASQRHDRTRPLLSPLLQQNVLQYSRSNCSLLQFHRVLPTRSTPPEPSATTLSTSPTLSVRPPALSLRRSSSR